MKNVEFWATLDKLIAESEIIVDRPKGARHPRYPEVIYPVDYGYLENTRAMDGGGIDVWRGASGENKLIAIIVTVDILKRDSEIKLLLGVSAAEIDTVMNFHNESEYMKGLLIARDN